MDKANRLYNKIEPFSALFLALGDVRYTAKGDPDCRPAFLNYGIGTVLYNRGQ